jgi:tRNA 2-(methylsulfanyl)-N6-isopentenyladenosine37 hydroxylase
LFNFDLRNIFIMLGLKMTTDPRWVDLIEAHDFSAVLSDHAWCEKKAASNAIAIITYNSDLEDLVDEMILIAKEELDHFDRVVKLIKKRGLKLIREEKDDYVNDLFKFMKKDGSRYQSLCERLLFAALIEARSCERFKTLSEHVKDEELAEFYRELMISEAGHYTTFLNFARKYAVGVDVEKRWKEWLEYENEVIQKYGKSQTIHG